MSERFQPTPTRPWQTSRDPWDKTETPELTGIPYNKHSLNSGKHVSPFDTGTIWIGLDGIEVKMVTDFEDEQFFQAVANAMQATTGLAPDHKEVDWDDVHELLTGGGLGQGLETVRVTFEVFRVSRACTHQLVRTRKGGFNQQSQRATFYGNNADIRLPETVWNDEVARVAAIEAIEAARQAYIVACERDLPYQDARYLFPEGVVNYIQCTYDLREWLATNDYRSCRMFQHEISYVFREMGKLLVERHPWLEPYAKSSCEKSGCSQFRGWESVDACPVPTCNDATRAFPPSRKNRIG